MNNNKKSLIFSASQLRHSVVGAAFFVHVVCNVRGSSGWGHRLEKIQTRAENNPSQPASRDPDMHATPQQNTHINEVAVDDNHPVDPAVHGSQ